MNTKQNVILYSILGLISLSIVYTTWLITNMGSNRQDILVIVFVVSTIMTILFFVPVATGLVLLSKKK